MYSTMPIVYLSGLHFKTYSYNGVPPRVGDTVTVTKEYENNRCWEGVVKSVSWSHHIDDDGEQSVSVSVNVGEKKPEKEVSTLGNIVKRVRRFGGRSRKRSGFVYFIANASASMVKIGYSTDPEGRRSNLQTSNHSKLETLLTMPGTEETETWLHQKFQAYRTEGEWFRLEGDLETYINVIGCTNGR